MRESNLNLSTEVRDRQRQRYEKLKLLGPTPDNMVHVSMYFFTHERANADGTVTQVQRASKGRTFRY
jgi:hypothetical protein